ncbi:MAG: hypothetical protein B7Y39_17285 [Bdellovibrio sp. 28-41-41]|nr:MAG: hypothetical protein B7Y39_17285 [Bdellovibrio sp. 28-41-41]
MKIALVAISFLALSTFATEAVQLNKESATTLRASCASDEFAVVELNTLTVKADSEYSATVSCIPAKCVSVNDSGKISVYRTAIYPKGYKGTKNYIRPEVLKSGVSGKKDDAVQEAKNFVQQGVCRTSSYSYTNAFIKLINSL